MPPSSVMSLLHLEDEFFQFSCKGRIDIAGGPAKQVSEGENAHRRRHQRRREKRGDNGERIPCADRQPERFELVAERFPVAGRETFNRGVYQIRDIERSSPQGRGGNVTYRFVMYSVPGGNKLDASFDGDDDLTRPRTTNAPAPSRGPGRSACCGVSGDR